MTGFYLDQNGPRIWITMCHQTRQWLYLDQFFHDKDFGDDDEEFLVTIIGTVFVEAEDEADAEDVARDVFDYMSKDEFEIHVSI